MTRLRPFSTVVAIVAVAATAVSGWSCAKGRPRVPSPEAEEARALIYFCQSGGGCRVKVWPERIRAYRGNGVTWEVDNGCSSEQSVALRDFRNLTYPAAPDPLENETLERRTTVAASARGEIKTRVQKDAVYGVYSYRLELKGGAMADPEIEIEGRP
jgi:hypothetical protein